MPYFILRCGTLVVCFDSISRSLFVFICCYSSLKVLRPSPTVERHAVKLIGDSKLSVGVSVGSFIFLSYPSGKCMTCPGCTLPLFFDT